MNLLSQPTDAMTKASGPRNSRWLSLGTLPVLGAVLVALNALYVLIVAFGNITDFGTNQAFVHHVLAMDTTNFGKPQGTDLDPNVMWRAIASPVIQNIAYVVLIAWEVATAVVLIAAVVLWIRERGRGYRTARRVSSIGLGMLLLLFFGGFTVVGGEWFQMWTSTAWNGEDPAFRNSVLALLTLIVIHLPSSSWRDKETDLTTERQPHDGYERN
jgi:predicted small integral membrane protein